LTDGTKALIDAGIADPQRICIVGWSYGGYAALLSVVEEPRFYQCAVSIAGVTDPMILIQKARNFMNRRWVKEYVGTDEAVIDEGSPLNRVDEIQVPVLMFHGDRDINVDVEHSKQLNKRLKRRKKDTELIIYEDAEHSLWRSTHRIDMLDRLGAFLDEHTAPSSVTTAGE
jgi:dipeptidyl aminopeptidase/acylaminoacyl peptidase